MISNNPFRIIGEYQYQSRAIHKNISISKGICKDLNDGLHNLPFLNYNQHERTEDLLLKSENLLNIDNNKIKYSLTWFMLTQPSIDSVALDYLIKVILVKQLMLAKRY